MIELEKSQNVRLADVLILGPFMLYLAMKGRMSASDRFFLGSIGVATMLYNLHNYRRIAAELQSQGAAAMIGARG